MNPTILVTGDFVLDHHIYEGRRHHYSDHRSRGVQEITELGGAALVHYLLDELKPMESHLGVVVDDKGLPTIGTGSVPDDLQAYATWQPFLKKAKDPESGVWRAAEAMGFGGAPGTNLNVPWRSLDEMPRQPDIVVISEGGMGFREDTARWPMQSLEKASWIVLKTAHPLADGELWQRLSTEHRDKLVVIASSHEMVKSTAHISRGFSWEETLESVIDALDPKGELSGLAQCRHIVISFDSDGGLWIEQPWNDGSIAHFVYEAATAEGEFRHSCKGKSFGTLSCLTAALAWRLALNPGNPDIESALEGGLSAMRDLLENGHGRAAAEPKGFPRQRLAKVIKEATCRYARATFTPASSMRAAPSCGLKRSPVAPARCWSVLHEALRELGNPCPMPAWPLGELVARRGPIALGSLPHLKIGGLMSADRHEIEALRILRRLILDYSKLGTRGSRPLSIGIFGPPGAGKSFAVKEIATSLVPKEGWMEFNLSQFKEGTEDLIGAFHQIRDRALRGFLPVAFFDEFDSREYRWLQYLLAPMQDGAFQEGQITHPIGKCILIFAGGTSHTFKTFGPPQQNTEACERFRMAKGPDFKSRLDGFLDVLGPNQRHLLELSKDGKRYEPMPDPDKCDIFFPIRRAFMIRSQLDLSPTDKLEIDDGLLRALLRVDHYYHGARSLQKVMEPLKAARPAFLNRSLSPPRNQLALHVDAERFLALCHEVEATPAPASPFSDTVRDQVACAIHEIWRALGREGGWLKPELNKDFPQLDEFFQASNRAAADRMVAVLNLIGLVLVSGNATAEDEDHIRLKIEYHLELLAEAEHDGWMDWHLDQGWQWGPARNDDKKIHNCLKPYATLSDQEKNKDRNTIRHYPEFAQRAGMKIAPAEAA